jgi:hypothetical protein
MLCSKVNAQVSYPSFTLFNSFTSFTPFTPVLATLNEVITCSAAYLNIFNIVKQCNNNRVYAI